MAGIRRRNQCRSGWKAVCFFIFAMAGASAIIAGEIPSSHSHSIPLERQTLNLNQRAALSLCLRIGFTRKPLRTFRSDATEPTDYRTENYRAPTPTTLLGGKSVSNREAMALWKSSGALFIDVMPRPRKPDNLPPKTLWRYPVRKNIPGSIWLPNTGYGVLNPAVAAYFRDNLQKLTKGDTAAPILFYCLRECWMSWNAAKRAIALGYSNVYWYADGSDGWSQIGGALQEAAPVEPVP